MKEASAGVVTDDTVSAALAHQRNAEEATRAGRASPVLPHNALVMTHTGRLLEVFFITDFSLEPFPNSSRTASAAI